MRSIKFALLMTMVFFIAGSVNANWSNESSVSAGAGPDLDIDPVTGHLHISAMNNGVIYTEMDANGAIIHQERVPNTGGIPGAGVFGTAISVDTEGNPHVCYRTDDGNHIYDIYYTHKDQSGWSTPLLIDENVKRGYMIRIDVDAQNRVHGVYGSAEGDNVWGPVTYFRIENGSITKRHNNLTQYRADDRVEIDASDGYNIHIILGCPDPNGGPVSYWRSTDGGNTMQYAGDIHDSAAIDRNGSPDLFVDAGGNVHFCYGAAQDRDVNRTPSVRYNRWQNSSQVRDVVATQEGDCKTWKQDQGIASLAASANGQTVMIAYTDTDGGDLYTTMSSDDGQHWQERDFIAAAVGGQESRNKHIIRAHGNTFYLVYPANGIKLRIYNSTPTDQPPTADAGGPYNAQPGESILFDGSNSTDDVGIISFEWDFGDGSTGNGVQVNHAYASEGVYDVTLTVTDSAGQTHSDHASAVIGTAVSTDWGNEIHISSGDTPDFDIHRATGNLHLLVMKNGVTYIELNSRGQVLQEETVPGTSGEEGMMRFGASIAVDSHGYPHIGYRNYRGSNYYDLYYIYKTESGWSSPIKIADRVLRGYVVRLAIDGADRVYYCHSSVTNTTTNTGPVNMHVYQNGQKLFSQNNIDQTRGDERYELDVSENGIVDLVAGDLSYPSEGGPVYYWRSSSPGEQLRYMGDQHHTDARGANGSPDIFVDALNNTHICYGVELDRTIGRKPSLRYLRMENGSKIRDVRVTDDGELSDWKFGLGIGSVAASADGQTVVAAYNQTEDGDLYTRISQDGGDTWGNREKLSAGWHSAETRNKHLIRANGNAFYLIYPRDGIKLRIMGNPPQAQPYLMVTPTELDFSNTQTEHSFTVKNSGGGTLTWNSGTINATWVTNIQPTGADLSSGQEIDVTVTIDRTGLADGNYNTILPITSNGGDIDVTLRMTVGGPSAWRINCGGEQYTDSDGKEWTADQAYGSGGYGYVGGNTYSTSDAIGGTSSDPLFQSERYDMSAYRFNVPDGDFQVTLHFAEIYNRDSNRRVFSVSLEGITIIENLDIYQEAGHDQALSYTFSTREEGIAITDNRIDLEFTDIIDLAKISAIEITTLEQSGPLLSINPSQLDFGSSGTVDTLILSNSGDAPLDWQAGQPTADWITNIQPASGSLTAGQSVPVFITIDRTGMNDGNYSATIPFTSNGGDKDLPVQMEVRQPVAILAIAPTTLDYGAFSESMTTTITNNGDLDLTWNAETSGRPVWVTSVSPETGSVPPGGSTEITISVSRDGLADGTHSGTVQFTSNGGDENVTLNITVGGKSAWRINCGGTAYTDGSGNEFEADRAYSAGGYGYVGGNTYATGDNISGTNDQPLFRSERYGMQAYRFDVPNGDYEITLHFAEIYSKRSGQRVFSVNLEGTTILDHLDLFAEAGHDVAYSRTFTTRESGLSINDNRIDLEFQNFTDVAKISAVEITPQAPPGPQLSITPVSLDFGTVQTVDTLNITNSGEGTLDWQGGQPTADWITNIQPASGSLTAGQSVPVFITIDRTGMNDGNYSATIPFTSNGGDKDLPVQMEVRQPVAILAIAPTTLDYGAFSESMTTTIINNGDLDLTWNAETSGRPAWVTSVSPETGSVPPGGSTEITISVSRDGLADGTHSGTVQFTSNGGDEDVTLNITVGGNSAWRINCGGAAYTDGSGNEFEADRAYSAGGYGYVGGNTYSVTSGISGTTDDRLYQSERYNVTAYRFDVPNGDYEITLHFAEIYYRAANKRVMSVFLEELKILDQLDLYQTAGYNTAYTQSFSTRELGVTISDNRIDIEFTDIRDVAKISAIEITPATPPGPALSVQPTAVDFGSSKTTDTLIVSNSGHDTLHWKIDDIAHDWITSVQPDSGHLMAGNSEQVIIEVTREGYSDGTYQGTIPFLSNDRNLNVALTMEVRQPVADLRIDQTSLNYGYFHDSLRVTLSNNGELELNWNVPDTSTASWITLSKSAGTIPAMSSGNISIYVQRSGLAEGDYADVIQILSNGGNAELNISMHAGDLRLNCGGAEYIDSNSKKWFADRAYSTDKFGYVGGGHYITTDAIAGTDNDPLYQSERYGMRSYRFDVPSNIDYKITLHFAETYHRYADRRVMSVALEGSNIITNMDIFEEVGHDYAMSYSFSTDELGIPVTDGRIDLDFSASKDSPKISAIEIASAKPQGPRLVSSVNVLDFGSAADTLSFTLSNDGDSSLVWGANVGSLPEWAQFLSDSTGSLSSKSSTELNVAVYRDGLEDGSYETVLNIYSTGGDVRLTIKMQIGGPVIFRVNCGGEAYTDDLGKEWAGDQLFSEGSFGALGGNTYSTNDRIYDTDADPLYQSERYGMSSYRFSVPEGHYIIVLHFAEIYYKAQNRRIFSIELEEQTLLQNLDIYSETGHDVAMSLSFNTMELGIPVTDGHLDLAFSVQKDAAKISAIEIERIASTQIANNAGTANENSLFNIPTEYKLWQNYPNPFNNSTMISFDLPEKSHVRLMIYNILGQQVITLVDEWMPVGSHKIDWNGRDKYQIPVPSGVYICRIVTDKYSRTMNMILLK